MMDEIGGYDECTFIPEFYDSVLPYVNRGDITYYVNESLRKGSSVLELGSGTGRVAIPMARAGLKVVGLDASSWMLRAFKERLKNEPEDIRSLIELRQENMRNFDLNKKFPTVILPFNTFLHMQNSAEQLSVLKCAHKHLEKDGHFLFDVFNPSLGLLTEDEYLGEFGHEPEVHLPDGRKFVRCHRIVERDLPNQSLDLEIIYYVTDSEGREEKMIHEFRLRYLFRFELEHLLDRGGFQLTSLFGDFEQTPFGETGDKLLVVKAKRKESESET